MKRVMTIQDISCAGKCSLTVALPVISALGVECCVVPTAVLSTHTMFKGFTLRDLTEDLPGIAGHWEREKFGFDAIYTGYLASEAQIDVVDSFVRKFKGKGNVVLVDPVMADNGKLYPCFDMNFARKMTSFVSVADIVVPNMTEASIMLGVPYVESGYDEEYVRDILVRLCGLGPSVSVLTGVSFEAGKLGVMSYSKATGKFFSYFHKRIDTAFHGTGDIFSSALTGLLARGESLGRSLEIAADYTAECIDVTFGTPGHVSYGVDFERVLPFLMRKAGII